MGRESSTACPKMYPSARMNSANDHRHNSDRMSRLLCAAPHCLSASQFLGPDCGCSDCLCVAGVADRFRQGEKRRCILDSVMAFLPTRAGPRLDPRRITVGGHHHYRPRACIFEVRCAEHAFLLAVPAVFAVDRQRAEKQPSPTGSDDSKKTALGACVSVGVGLGVDPHRRTSSPDDSLWGSLSIASCCMLFPSLSKRILRPL